MNKLALRTPALKWCTTFSKTSTPHKGVVAEFKLHSSGHETKPLYRLINVEGTIENASDSKRLGFHCNRNANIPQFSSLCTFPWYSNLSGKNSCKKVRIQLLCPTAMTVCFC